MKSFLFILIITIAVVAICGMLLAVKIIIQKNGRFSHTCAFDFEKKCAGDCKGDCKVCTKNSIGKVSQ